MTYICENCKIEHNGSYGSGRFCSSKCARGFSTKAKRSLINEKVSKKMMKFGIIVKKCQICGNEFNTHKNRQKNSCSNSCAMKLRNSNPETKLILSKRFSELCKKRYAKGDSTLGWQSRKNMPMSSLEILAYNILLKNNINFEREYKINKWFIDFALVDKKIAIELDGKQHEHEKRKINDDKKDKYLLDNGWTVIRIKYWEKNKEEKLLKAVMV